MLTFILHHGGNFRRQENGLIEYEGGEICVWDRIEPDYCNTFLLEDLTKHCRHYHGFEHIWWLDPERGFENGLYEINTDEDILTLCDFARRNNDEADVYYGHPVIRDPEIVIPPPAEEMLPLEEGVQVQTEPVKEPVEVEHAPVEPPVGQRVEEQTAPVDPPARQKGD